MRILLPLGTAAALLLAITFTVIAPGLIPGKIPSDDITRIKGLDSRLFVYRKNNMGVEELKNGSRAGKGDLLQIGYAAAGQYTHGVILSIDGRGFVTLQYPASPEDSTEITQNRKILLNQSYELDDAPRYERFILVLSSTPLNIETVLKKAKILAKNKEMARNGQLDVNKDTREMSLTIEK